MATVTIVPYVRLPEYKSTVLLTLAKPPGIVSVCFVSVELISRRTLEAIPPEEQTICSRQQPSVYGAYRLAKHARVSAHYNLFTHIWSY